MFKCLKLTIKPTEWIISHMTIRFMFKYFAYTIVKYVLKSDWEAFIRDPRNNIILPGTDYDILFRTTDTPFDWHVRKVLIEASYRYVLLLIPMLKVWRGFNKSW